MKNTLLLLMILLLFSCGYKPVFSGQDINFYIDKILNIEDDNTSRKIIKKLSPYSIKNDKQSVNLEIKSNKDERVISKDSKGDPLVFEIKIEVDIKIKSSDNENAFNYVETFSFNNQTNKFELKQYKNNIEDNLIDKIFERIIIDIRSI